MDPHITSQALNPHKNTSKLIKLNLKKINFRGRNLKTLQRSSLKSRKEVSETR